LRFNYPTHVNFDCSKCGLCCGDTAEKVRHVLLLESDAERIERLTNLKANFFAAVASGKLPYLYEMKKGSDQKCVFLKDNQCMVYDIRPLICRFYPFELSTNDEGVHTFRVTDECPGVRCSDKSEVKEISFDYFRALLELAWAELKVDCNEIAE
jgi:Fe-S-cluster containining protein